MVIAELYPNLGCCRNCWLIHRQKSNRFLTFVKQKCQISSGSSLWNVKYAAVLFHIKVNWISLDLTVKKVLRWAFFTTFWHLMIIKTVVTLPKCSPEGTWTKSIAAFTAFLPKLKTDNAWQRLTLFSPACRPCPLSPTDSSPSLRSCRAGSWPVSWWSAATRARSWAGRNLRRGKQLHRLKRLRGATLSTTGPDQCELNPDEPTELTEMSSAWLTLQTDSHQPVKCWNIRRLCYIQKIEFSILIEFKVWMWSVDFAVRESVWFREKELLWCSPPPYAGVLWLILVASHSVWKNNIWQSDSQSPL